VIPKLNEFPVVRLLEICFTFLLCAVLVKSSNKTIWTAGHSTRSLDEFVELLQVNRIAILADVRRFPGSRKHPHFGKDVFSASLAGQGIQYVHFPELGGRRTPRPDSPNIAWRNPSFRGYADYMDTDEFRAGIERLLQFASEQRTAIMCSEAVWWRCHRALIADFLKAAGWEVIHILNKDRSEPHPFTSVAKLREQSQM
jgi:uncharacterized protein (DUF488 family)